jgi:hypothetical protein
MTPRGEQEVQVRRFLLGQLDESEQQRVEETLMVDTDYREQILLAEEILIEDYLDGVLPAEEQKAFETHFVASAQQRRKVKLARLLNTFDSSNLQHSDHSAAPRPLRRQSWPMTRMVRDHAVMFGCVAAALLLILGFGVFQSQRLWRETRQQDAAQQRKLQIERELTQLSSAAPQDLPASTLALVLAPVALRDPNAASTVSMPFSAEIIELRLILSGNPYSRYMVGLSRIGGTETYRVDGLNAQPAANGQAVVVRIPSRLLSPGDYKLGLIGIAPNGNKCDAGEYVLHVGS